MWFTIGIQLGIPRHVLKQFEGEIDPLSAVVDFWLTGNVKESAVHISWKSIVEALKSDCISELALAEKISKKHCSQDDTKANKGKELKDSLILQVTFTCNLQLLESQQISHHLI